MLKRPITYENYFGEQVTADFYFNISKAELTEMELSGVDGSFAGYIQRVINAGDRATLIAEFKKLVLTAYGKRSDDGERFIKSDELRAEFEQSAAYSALFMELATDDGAAAAFFTGILPKDLQNSFDPASKTIQAPPLSPPPPPS